MEPRTIGSYGGPKVDAAPVEDPTSQIASSEWNRQAEDIAQMTRTTHRAVVKFTTAAVHPTVVAHRSVWGTGDHNKPAVLRMGAGQYQIGYNPTITDAIGDTETVGFFAAHAACIFPHTADRLAAEITAIGSNYVQLITLADGSVDDVSNWSGVNFQVMVWID